MADYVEFHCPQGDNYEGGDACDRCEKYELCMETPAADVVERSEYDKLKKELDHYKRLVDAESDLRLKLDNALTEIKNYKHENGNMFTSGLEKAVEIINNNIAGNK